MPLRLYNTFAKKEEEFHSIEPKLVRMYTCGPTVYGRPHIGNYSSFLMADLLRRWLEESGYEVRHVKNITDVGHLVADLDEGEDKIEKQAKEEKTDPLAIARKYTDQYLADEHALNMEEPFARPRATETIAEMIRIIEELVKSGHAYETDDGVYFAVETFPAYGKLSGNTLAGLDAGSRVDVNEHKKHPADFALWKKTVGSNAHHLLKWPSPFGDGFPGWHIECSAMAKKFLGDQLDIHTGGEDNIFPHHECEIAQSECSGPCPFSRYWIHKRRIDIALNEAEESQKMSKSLGNVVTIDDIVSAGFSPMDLRYYLLSVHYRTRLKFTWRGLDDAKKARRKILEWMIEMEEAHKTVAPLQENERKKIEDEFDRSLNHNSSETRAAFQKFIAMFDERMDNDLDTAGALGVVFSFMTPTRLNIPVTVKADFFPFVQKIRHTFGCFDSEEESELPSEVQTLVVARAEARTQKNFAESDRLRGEIEKLGYTVKDGAEGQKVQRR